MSLTSSLATLESSGLIRLAQAEPEIEYLFRHALLQDAAYESILKADRRILHHAIGETLEQLYPERLASRELAPTLGQHFAAAGETERARKYFTLAGDTALAEYANVEAEQHYRAALAWGDGKAERVHLLASLGETLFGQGRYEEALQVWREGIELTQALGDHHQVARLYARSARAASWPFSTTPRNLALCREGLAAIGDGPETAGLTMLVHETARACVLNGLVAEAEPLCQQAMAMAERLGHQELLAEALTTHGLVLNATGRPHEAAVVHTRAIELAETAGFLRCALRAYSNLVEVQIYSLGEFRAALVHFQHSLTLAQKLADVSEQLFVLSYLVMLSLELGDFTTAEETLTTQQRTLANVNPNPAWYFTTTAEARFRRYRGELEAAQGRLQAAQDDARAEGDPEYIRETANLLADIELELGQWALAEQALIEGIELSDRGLGEGAQSRCLFVAVLARQGRIAEARRWLAGTRARLKSSITARDEERLRLAEARLAAAEEHWPEALAAFESAASRQAKMEMRWRRAQTLRDWAEAHLARHAPGDVNHARNLLREALSEFEAMNVPKYAALVRERLAGVEHGLLG
jgi:tetratricopeptide (TPR) repeat protein